MANYGKTKVDCQLVGDYVDERDVPLDRAYHCGEVVRPQVVATYVDVWAKDDGSKEGTELNDGDS